MVQTIPPFVCHCMELLAPLGAVRARRMFGGWGLHADEIFVAIIAADRLFLKTSAESRPGFEAAGCEPFVYDAKSKAVAMSYWSAPPDALDSPALMLPWARGAMQAALQTRAVKLAEKRQPRTNLKPRLKPELKPKRAPRAPPRATPGPRKPRRAA